MNDFERGVDISIKCINNYADGKFSSIESLIRHLEKVKKYFNE